MAALSVGIVVHHLNRSNPIAVKMAPQDRSSSKGHSDQPPVSLANWESPTDFLLQPPDDWARSTN
jgi:hypothetical protein